MHLIALTGGIASGKSTVANRLAEHGAVIIDADQVARQVVDPGTPALEAIRQRFGAEILRPDGSLNRPALAAIIFNDAASRDWLNSITHPAVWKRTAELLDVIHARDSDAIVIYDVPLLVEASSDRPMEFERVIVVDTPAEVRLKRLVELRHMSESDARARLASQASDEERLQLADFVIHAGGTLDSTMRQVDELWSVLLML